MNHDFYIGWEAKASTEIRQHVRWMVAGLLVMTLGLALAFAATQQTIGISVFEWGTVKKFSGVLRLQPYPHLLVSRPGKTSSNLNFSTYYLVAPFKFGLPREKLASFDGKTVSLQGTLIYRSTQTMIEVIPDSIKAGETKIDWLPDGATIGLRRQKLVGEIVDSKCFLGVMNPGQLLPHRACAIRCISGGIPPVLLVRQPDGSAHYFLLVSTDGRPVNREVLDLVAEPVQITGEVERQGELLILRADPKTIRRIK